jgi:glycosyltransferase involved in cell wall biosynthesis
MKKRKIIHLLSVEPLDTFFNYDPEYFNKHFSSIEYTKIGSYPYWVGFFRADHHSVAAKEFVKSYPEYEVECWRPYGKHITKVYEKNVDGIIHKVFPSRELKIPQIGHFTWSPEILLELEKESKKNEILLNISVGHLWFHMYLLFKLKYRNFPIICEHRSGGFKKFYYKRLSLLKKIIKPYYLLENQIEICSLKNADYYLSGSMVETSYMKDNLKMKNVDFFMDGVDFDYFKPGGDKIALRDKLGLPKDKKILMVTGNFRSSDYGYDKLVNCYKKVKELDKDIALLMIGGYKSEDVYQMGVDAGCIMIERVSKDVLLDYYRASDYFSQAIFNPIVIEHGGFGSATIEALACGLPLISNNIIHFPGTRKERDEIGIDMQTEDDLVKNIIYVKNNLVNYKNCRVLAQKYFDINDTRKVLAEKYEDLLKKYYAD